MSYGQRLYQGYARAGDLLVIRVVQLFERTGRPEHLTLLEQFVTDVQQMVPPERAESLYRDIAKAILNNAKEIP